MSYSTSFKESVWCTPGWILLALVGAYSWSLVTKALPDPSKLMIVGLYWDSGMQLTYLLVPLLFFGSRLSLTQGIGVLLVFIGLMLTRYHV